MRRTTLMLAVLIGIGLPAPAQQVIPIFSGGNPLTLLQNQDVQKDLKFSAEQTTKIRELGEKYQKGLQGIDVRKAQEFSKSIADEAGKVLDAGQAKRLEEIKLQQKGSRA